jgi:hypothetical protein
MTVPQHLSVRNFGLTGGSEKLAHQSSMEAGGHEVRLNPIAPCMSAPGQTRSEGPHLDAQVDCLLGATPFFAEKDSTFAWRASASLPRTGGCVHTRAPKGRGGLGSLRSRRR